MILQIWIFFNMELPIFIIIPKINQSISDDAAGDIFYTNNIEFNLCSLCLIFALFGYIAIGNYIVLYSISEIHFMRETVKYDFHMFQFSNFRIFEFIFFRPPIQWDKSMSKYMMIIQFSIKLSVLFQYYVGQQNIYSVKMITFFLCYSG